MQARKTQFDKDLAAKEEARKEKKRGMAKELRDLEAELDEERKLQQAMKDIQHDAEEAHSTKNEVLQQSKDLEKKIKGLEADLAQMQEDLSASERQGRTAAAEQDKLAEELSSTGPKGVMASDGKRRLDARIAALEGDLEEEQTQSEMMMERARKNQICIEQLTTELASATRIRWRTPR